MSKVQAWLLPAGSGDQSQFPGLSLDVISLGKLKTDEALVEPLLVGWEGNCHHAVERSPIDICRARKEEFVVLGNSGIVRVLKPAENNVNALKEGDICMLQGNYRPDKFGYMQNGGAFGYDAEDTIGLLAKRTKIRTFNLYKIPQNTRHSKEQWAAFGIRYVTAWANWRLAYGVWRLQITEKDQPIPYVWGWGGGTSFAELTLAQRFGAQACIVSSRNKRIELAKANKLSAVDRRNFPDLSYDPEGKKNFEYEQKYHASEEVFLSHVKEATDGLGVSIFIDYIGAPLLRATLKALARQGVVTTAGWREGMSIRLLRGLECIQRHQHIHTHFARPEEVWEAMDYGEKEGWMPPIAEDEYPYDYEGLPELVNEYASGNVDTYFPLVKVND